MPSASQVLGEKMLAKRRDLKEIFEKARGEDGKFTITKEQAEDIGAREKELTALAAEYKSQVDMEDLERKNQAELDYLNSPDHPTEHEAFARSGARAWDLYGGRLVQPKSAFELLRETKEFKAAELQIKTQGKMSPFEVHIPSLDVKTTFTEGSSFAPANDRTSTVVYSAQRPLMVADLIPQDTTTLQTIKYMEETTHTNNAVEKAEGAAAGEAAIAFTERSVIVEWLPVILPVTDQVMEDVGEMESILKNRLGYMIGNREDSQLIVGDGISPNIKGFYAATGLQTQAVGADPIPDAILKAMVLVQWTGMANASGMIMHPTNWQTVRLLPTTTGEYLWGPPSVSGPQMAWGMPVVVTSAITVNTALVGDFRGYSRLARRRGMTFAVGYINDDFQKGKKTIRADERLALVVYRGAAFCKITGLS